MTHLVVVGGGIAGLSAAWFARKADPAVRITVIESERVLGGKLQTSEVGGVAVDSGAESFLITRPEARALVRDLELGAELEAQAVTGASLWTRGSLRPLPRGQVMGVPTDLRELGASEVLSLAGLLRIPLDRVLPAVDLGGQDVAVGPLVADRLGREVVQRLVEPLLGGVYAGHADQLSLSATVPGLAAALRRENSLLAAAERVAARGVKAGPPFATVTGGLGRLVTALAEQSGAELRLGAPVTGLRRGRDGWLLDCGGDEVAADAVILAVPAPSSGGLLRGIAPFAAAEMAAIEYASVAIVTVVADAPPRALSGTGFLVPPVDGHLLKAATYSSAKWASVGAAAAGRAVIRCSVGRLGETEALGLADDDLTDAVWAELVAATGLAGRPQASRVTRWPLALPQYAVGHPARVARIRAALRGMTGLALAGAALDGVGIPACIASAEAAVAGVSPALTAAAAAG